jgi:hypothetical protein
LVDSLELPAETLPAAFHLGYGSALSGTPNVEGEPQEIKTILLNALHIRPFREGHKSCLLFIELQSVFLKTLHKRTENAFGVALILAVDDWSSSAGELPPDALTDPNVNLSAHSAPIVQPLV